MLLGLVNEGIVKTHGLVWELRISCWLSGYGFGFGFGFVGLIGWLRTTMDAGVLMDRIIWSLWAWLMRE